MIFNQSLNVTSLVEPIAAVNKQHRQLPPQRSLTARQSQKTLVQPLPQQRSKTHSNENNNEGNSEIMLQQRRGSALVSQIMRRLSRAQSALPSHDIHIHETSNVSEDINNDNDDGNNNNNNRSDNDETGTGKVNKKTLSGLPILHIPVPPSILKTSSESVPNKVQGRKIQFIDPILSNSSSQVDSMSNTSFSMLQQTPDRRLDANQPQPFIVASDNNDKKSNNLQETHLPQNMNAYYDEGTPLKESADIVNNAMKSNNIASDTNNNLKNSTSTSQLQSPSSSILSSPLFGSLQSTPHQHHTPHLQSSLHTLAQVHPLMETNRPNTNKQNAQLSMQQVNNNHTQTVPQQVHRAAPLPARPRMSHQPINKAINSSSHNVSNNQVAEMAKEAMPSTLNQHNEKERSENTDIKNDLQKNGGGIDSTALVFDDGDKAEHLKDKIILLNTQSQVQAVKQNNNYEQNVESSINNKKNAINSSDEDHFSAPTFLHGQHASSSNAKQTSQQTQLTKADLSRQLRKYEEQVRQNAQRSLRSSGQNVQKTHPVGISRVDTPLQFTHKTKPTETIKVKQNTQASTKIPTDGKTQNQLKVNNQQMNTNINLQDTNTVQVPVIDTSLASEMEQQLPHVPSVNQISKHDAKIPKTIQHSYKQNDEIDNKDDNIINHVQAKQTRAQMQIAPQQVVKNINTKQQQPRDKTNQSIKRGDNMQSMLYQLLYSQLSGAKNKHSLQYLMNRWEKRQKRDLVKRMQQVLGADAHLGQHHTSQKSKHEKHHKSHGKKQQQHHRKKQKSDSKKRKDSNKHKHHQSHKHKHPSPHHQHHRHHRQSQQNNGKDVQKKSNKNDINQSEKIQNNQDYQPVDVVNDFVSDHSVGDDNNINVDGTTHVLGNQEQRTDYKTLSLQELKAAARRNALQFTERAKYWQKPSHQTLPSFTSRPTTFLYNDYNYQNNNMKANTNSCAHERQTRAALREKYLGRRTISPFARIGNYSSTHPINAQYRKPRNNTVPYYQKDYAQSNHFDDRHDPWNGYPRNYNNNSENYNYNNENENENDVNIDDKHYFNDDNVNIKNNGNKNQWNADEDEVHSYYSYQDNDNDNDYNNDNVYRQIYRFSSPLSSTHQHISPRQQHYQPIHRVNSIKKRFTFPLPSPLPDTNTSPTFQFNKDNKYYDLHSRVDELAQTNQKLPTLAHADLPTFEVRDLRAARELASGVRTIIHSLKSYVNSVQKQDV